MARLSVTWGDPRLTVTYPAVASELAKLLAADLSGVSALAPGLEQGHRLASSLSASAEIDGDVQAGAFTLAAALEATGAFASDVSQTHELAASLAGAGALTGNVALSFDLGADFSATGALASDVSQTHELAASLAGVGALTGNLEVTTGAGDPAFRCVAVSYTGNGGTQAITGVGFQPELIIILDAADTTNAQRWITQANDVGQHWKPGGDGFPNFDATQSLSGVTSFDADGFTLGSNSKMNANGTSYVALCLAAGTGTEAANFEAQLQTRQFTQVTYTHSLGALPIWVWSKRDDQAPGEWISDAGLQTDSNNLGGTIAANPGAVIAVSSNDITIGTDVRWNGGSDISPLILFGSAESAGKYKTGTYIGTGAANNAISGLGFQPSVVMIRSIDGLGLSILTNGLSPQTAFVIGTGNRDAAFTLDADGFTVNGNDEINRSGETFRYFAWV